MIYNKYKNIKSMKSKKKSKILLENKLDLLISNKIIFNKLNNRLIDLFNDSNEKESLKNLFKIIYYIWLIKNQNYLNILKEKCIIDKKLLKRINFNNSIDVTIDGFNTNNLKELYKYMKNIDLLNLSWDSKIILFFSIKRKNSRKL